jgi:surface protein
MKGMFAHSKFNQDISQWNTSRVENMQEMFAYSKFNQDISNWDFSNVMYMGNILKEANYSHEVGIWNVPHECDGKPPRISQYLMEKKEKLIEFINNKADKKKYESTPTIW